MAKVTIAIPTYNRVKFLEKALRGCLAQTFKDIEILIVDNASTDGTNEMVRDYMSIDNRVRYVRNSSNLGALNNFNKCIDLVDGEYFILHQDDDFMLERMIETGVRVLDDNPDISCFISNSQRIDIDGNYIRGNKMRTDVKEDIVFTRESFLESYCKRYSGEITSVLFRTEMLKQKNSLRFVGTEGGGYGADNLFWVEFALLCDKLYFHAEPLVLRGIHELQTSTVVVTAFTNFNEAVLSLEAISKSDVGENIKRMFCEYTFRALLAQSCLCKKDARAEYKVALTRVYDIMPNYSQPRSFPYLLKQKILLVFPYPLNQCIDKLLGNVYRLFRK